MGSLFIRALKSRTIVWQDRVGYAETKENLRLFQVSASGDHMGMQKGV